MCEPQVFELRAGSSLAKLPSDGRAGGPRLGLDTSLISKYTYLGPKYLAYSLQLLRLLKLNLCINIQQHQNENGLKHFFSMAYKDFYYDY